MMRQSLMVAPEFHQSVELRLEQRLKIQAYTLRMRLTLLQQLHDEKYEPEGKCLKCGRNLTLVEILAGFNQDPNDYTTRCTGCGTRFEPKLICSTLGFWTEVPFYCDSQVLHQLGGKEDLSPEDLKKEFAAIYHSAIFHHGTLRRAFKKVNREYAFDEAIDWKEKVKPFLGRLPDTVVAECVNVSVGAIRKIRKAMGVPRFTATEALDE